jgi:glycosyltransferase involved in cell wall biosynthesis
MPAVSVLMPCYNVQYTIDDAISSLINQSLGDFELVAADDGSTDGTLSQLQKWAQRDQRIRVIQLPHQGIISTLNAGIQACRCAFIARMDADDRSTPDRLKQQVNMLADNPDLALVSGLVRGFPEGNLGIEFRAYISWLNSLHTEEDIKREIFVMSPLAHPSVAYRREWVEKVGGYQDHGWAEDYDLWVRLYLAGAKFGKVNDVLLEWRDHPQRLTHTDGRYSSNSDLRLKAHYLVQGPPFIRKKIYIWGVGMIARQLGEQLMKLGCTAATYIETHQTLEGSLDLLFPVISAENFLEELKQPQQCIVLLDEKNKDIEIMLSHKFRSLQLLPGVDWFKIT